MRISRKNKHRLIDLMIHLIPLQTNVIPILQREQIPFGNIVLEGNASTMWFNIIDYCDNNNYLDPLLSVLIASFPNNLDLKEIKEDFAKQSLPTLVEHLRSIIVKRQCVLFLGPYILNCVENAQILTFNRYFSKKLAAELSRNDIYYDRDEMENLSYIIDRYETRDKFVPGDTEKEAKRSYTRGMVLDNLYRPIDRFDFPLIVNTNPDTILRERFGEQKYIHRHYDITNTSPQLIPRGFEDKTIVYNIYGSFENEYSIIFTEKEAVEFTKKAYEKTPPIPVEIKSIVKNSYGLFLGFDFKEWHLKILFDVLDLRNKPGNYSISDANTNISERDKEYYERQYNMTFISEDLLSFIDLL